MTPDLILTLGDFEFTRHEVPESIALGGEQMLSVHRMVGGKRIIDAMGANPEPLSWSGWFVGEEALGRAQYLDSLRARGEELKLTFSELTFRVVIRSFRYVFQRQYQLTYSITLEVIEDLNLGDRVLPVPSVNDLVTADIKTVDVLTASVNDPTLTTKVTGLKAAIKSVSDFAKATQAQINSVLGPIKEARAQANTLLASANNTIQNVTTLGGILPNNPVAQQASRLLDQVNAMNSAPQLVQLDSVLGRVQTNVTTANSGSKTITVATGTLFDVAAREYGDAQAWTTIARANGLTDPQITAPVTLVIPPKADGAGGVLNG